MTNGITLHYCINGAQTINKNRIGDTTTETGIGEEKRARRGTKRMRDAHGIVSNLNLIGRELGGMVGLI